jgi:hypothetical protein
MKIVFMLICFATVAVLCFGGVTQFGIGFDLSGNHKVHLTYIGDSASDEYDVDTGISPSIEVMARRDNVLYGAGIEYQLPRSVDFGEDKGKMGFLPVYGVLRIQIPSESGVTPEFVGQLGYNIFTADDDYKGDADLSDGLYWGFGAGLSIQNVILQLMYKTNEGGLSLDWDGSKIEGEITNTQINFTGGVRF